MPLNRFDAIDAESFEDMLASRSFLVYQNRIIKELERKRDELEALQGPDITDYNRGFIASLRMVLGLPGQIHSEMKAPKKGQK